MKKQIIFFLFYISHFYLSAQSFDGFALFNSSGSSTTKLIDKNLNIVHEWNTTTDCNYTVLLKKNGNLVRGTKYSGNILNGAADGGRVQELAPDGSIVWDFIYSDANHLSHHDMTLIGDNVLLTAWEVKSATEVSAAGYTGNIGNAGKWPTHFIELEPDGNGGANIVWEWHIWDHLCQDVDPNKPNYVTNISEHPHLIDINMIQNSGGGPGGGGGDWFHVNGVDYNEELDQIVFSSRFSSEIYIIDHSTTTQEAAGSTGGNSGMGGDILYRWGNPSNYGMPGAQIITSAVHDSRWIENDGRPNGGFLQIFNNCGNGCTGGGPNSQANSTIDGIETPWDPLTKTYTRNAGQPFGPSSYTTRYECQYSSGGQSASNRMSNGNIFVNASGSGAGVMYEVDGITEQIVWGPYPSDSQKGFRYECDYPGIIALKNWLSDTTTCSFPSNDNFIDEENKFIIYPNPSSYDINIDLALFNQQIEGLFIYDMFGKIVFSQEHFFNNNFSFTLDGLKRGIYTVNILTSSNLYTKHFSYSK